jgi:hypothetical protein
VRGPCRYLHASVPLPLVQRRLAERWNRTAGNGRGRWLARGDVGDGVDYRSHPSWFCRRCLDFAHVPMVYGGHLAIVPGDRNCIPTSAADGAAISGITAPEYSMTLLKIPRFGSGHTAPPSFPSGPAIGLTKFTMKRGSCAFRVPRIRRRPLQSQLYCELQGLALAPHGRPGVLRGRSHAEQAYQAISETSPVRPLIAPELAHRSNPAKAA